MVGIVFSPFVSSTPANSWLSGLQDSVCLNFKKVVKLSSGFSGSVGLSLTFSLTQGWASAARLVFLSIIY